MADAIADELDVIGDSFAGDVAGDWNACSRALATLNDHYQQSIQLRCKSGCFV